MKKERRDTLPIQEPKEAADELGKSWTHSQGGSPETTATDIFPLPLKGADKPIVDIVDILVITHRLPLER